MSSGASHSGLPFNPYKVWLGIESSGRKPTHYEMLGLDFGVVDAEKAKASVIERSAKVRHYQAGKHAELAAQLLDELAEAQLVLTNPEKKRQYDLSFVVKESKQVITPSTQTIIDEPPFTIKPQKVKKAATKTKKKSIAGPVFAILFVVLVIFGHLAFGFGAFSLFTGSTEKKEHLAETIQPVTRESATPQTSSMSNNTATRNQNLEPQPPIDQKSITLKVNPEIAKVSMDSRFGDVTGNAAERKITLRNGVARKDAKIVVNADGYQTREIDLPIIEGNALTVCLETKKYYLSELGPPKSQNAEHPWRNLKGDQKQANSFLLHPFKAPLVAFVRYETESMTAFSSKVRLDHDPGSPVRFAVKTMDKIIWMSRALTKKGDSDECWLDIRGWPHIELLTRAHGDASAAWAIWEDPHFIKTDIYEKKAKETAKFLDYSSVQGFWSVGVHDLTTGMPPKVASFSKNPVKPELIELYSMTRFIRGNWAGSNCALTSEIASYQSFGWKKDHLVCSVCKNQTAGMVLLVRKKQPNSQIIYFELVSGPKINKSVATPLGWVWKEQPSDTNFKDDVVKVEVHQDAGGHWRLSSDSNEIEFLTQKRTWNTRFAFWAFKK